MNDKATGEPPIQADVQPTQTFSTAANSQPNNSSSAFTTLESLRGHLHSRREVDAYLDIGTSPLYQLANNK